MDDIKQMAKTVAECIKGDTKKTKAYDTAAKVKRIENGTAYVEIPGGVSETPVKLTIDAKVGDTVQVHVGNGTAWLVGNRTAPPTDDTEAIRAKTVAVTAEKKADAVEAIADKAQADADRAKTAADHAEASATSAQASAQNASEYASRALGNLSTVQSVAETLTWITAHGTMALTTDVALDPTHVYFVVDAGGDYTVGGVTYAIVTEPDVADIGTYYELSIDESLNNYVGTHLALDSEGLWLLPATSGTNKVLIATGAGSTYTVAGTYLIDSSGNTAASFRADGATMSASGVQIAHLGYGAGTNSGGGTSDAPYYDIGKRLNGSTKGNYSTAEGDDTTASGYASHSEGTGTTASGHNAHAEGSNTTASGNDSHAQNRGTIAGYTGQTAIGRYNENKSSDLLEIGNGSGPTSRSNAFEVSDTGDVKAAGELIAANIGAKQWMTPAAVSCQTGKWYKVAEVTLDPGLWLIDCNAIFPNTNTTGIRQIRVTTATFTNGTTTAPASYANLANDILVGAATVQYPQSHFPVNINSQTTFRLAAYQSSGSTVSVTGRMYATRIK